MNNMAQILSAIEKGDTGATDQLFPLDKKAGHSSFPVNIPQVGGTQIQPATS